MLKQMEVCIPTMYLSWAEQPSKKCMSWQAARNGGAQTPKVGLGCSVTPIIVPLFMEAKPH